VGANEGDAASRARPRGQRAEARLIAAFRNALRLAFATMTMTEQMESEQGARQHASWSPYVRQRDRVERSSRSRAVMMMMMMKMMMMTKKIWVNEDDFTRLLRVGER